MAELIPSLEEIKNRNKEFINIEKILKKLKDELGNDYKVYYKPFLNGDRPDIIILKENLGILIISLIDWRLKDYSIKKEVISSENTIGFKGQENENARTIIFRRMKDNSIVANPFEQLNRYKAEFYGPHIERLFMDKIVEPKLFGSLVKTAIYFFEENEINIKNKFNEFKDKNRNGKPTFADIVYTKKWNKETDIIKEIEKDFREREIKKGNESFKKLARENNSKFKQILAPPFHEIDKGEYIKFVKKQKSLALSKENENKKIKGVAGSGKTLLLAHRAVAAAKRTSKTVLILTYNITICNYIRNRIDKVQEEFGWDMFEINNYHAFIKDRLRDCGYRSMKLFDPDDKEENYRIENDIYQLFKQKRDELRKYDAIFIDECQDFNKIWLDTIKDNFLDKNGEFVIFADEKQNIYERDLDKDKKVKTNIVGKWNELNQSFRIKNKISKLAEIYQEEFMKSKYELDIFENEQIGFEDNSGEILYRYAKGITNVEIEKIIMEFLEKKEIHYNRVCILGMQVKHIRELEKYIRDKDEIEFELDIETQEEYEEMREKSNNFQRDLEDRRRIRKQHFCLDSGKMKISTTHSFKGWELENIVLIIDGEDGNTTDELIYTAFTRAKENLIIFNRGNWKIDKFFNEKVEYTPI